MSEKIFIQIQVESCFFKAFSNDLSSLKLFFNKFTKAFSKKAFLLSDDSKSFSNQFQSFFQIELSQAFYKKSLRIAPSSFQNLLGFFFLLSFQIFKKLSLPIFLSHCTTFLINFYFIQPSKIKRNVT